MTRGAKDRLSIPWRTILGGGLIAAAMAGVILARFSPESPVFLTPYDGITDHEIHIVVDGQALTSDAIMDRYGIPVRGSTTFKPAGLKSLVRFRESGFGETGETFVRLHLRRNGGSEHVWLWPER